MPLSVSKDFHVVESDTKGKSLFTSRKFSKGECIYLFDYWSKKVMPIHVTNHSCEPNSSFNAAGELIALYDLEANEEITYDYLLHPIPASPWDFTCLCQTDGCIGRVKVATRN
ncbi:MAG: hypothetical protein K1Y36_20165 [Blastocatellia bacterium]|nr:hypothetical protein [Blastocatellia bacterium]